MSKIPIYSLGRKDPIKISETAEEISCFSGIDVKVHLVNPEQDYKEVMIIKGVEAVHYPGQQGNIQEVNFMDNKGSLSFIVFDDIGMDFIERLVGKTKRLVLEAVNEDRKRCIICDKIIILDDCLMWSIGIDDVVFQVNINFIQAKDLKQERLENEES